MEEFRHYKVLFMIKGREQWEIHIQISRVSAVMWKLCWQVLGERVVTIKVKLSNLDLALNIITFSFL